MNVNYWIAPRAKLQNTTLMDDIMTSPALRYRPNEPIPLQ